MNFHRNQLGTPHVFKASLVLLLALGFVACGAEPVLQEETKAQANTPAIIAGGTYQIVNLKSGKVLSVEASTNTDGAGVIQSGYIGSSSQQWKIIADASAYKIQNLNSSKFLDLDVSVGGGLNDGAKLQQWSEGVSQINQRWEFGDLGAGLLKISSKLSAKVLDVAGASSAENAKVHQWTYLGNANQQWKLIPVATSPTPPPVSPPPITPPPTPPPSVTADFYVAPSGDDANAGSNAKPFRTIQRAVASVKAGQTVLVRGGVYFERRISFAGAGTVAAPITFKAVPGERVVIDHGLRVPNWNLESGSVYKGAPDYVAGAPKDRTLAVVVAGRPLEQVTGALREGTWSLEPSTGLVRVWAFGGASPATQEVVIVNSSDEFGLRTGIYIGGDGNAVGHVVFDGFVHRGAETAIWATNFGRSGGAQNSGLTLKNCEIAFNWQYALRLDGWKGALMENCDVHRNGLVHYPVTKEVTWPHSIIGWDGDDVTVTGSKVHDNYGEGIGPFSGCSNWKITNNEVYDNYSVNIYIDTSDGDMLVDRNLVYNTGKNGRGYKISPDNIRVANEDADLYKTDPTPNIYNVTITNNIVLGVGPGITSFRYQGGSSYLQNSVIANNTVLAVAGYGGWDTDAIYVNPGENVTVANNIVYGGRITIGDGIGAGVDLKNNWVADASKINASAQNVTVTGTRFGDPKFALGTGFTSDAYRLSSGSPARDAGVSLTAVLTDFAGLARPQGNAFDIGAFEER